MKTNQKGGFFRNLLGNFRDRTPFITRKMTGAEDELIVIRDVSTGKDYFLSIIDNFYYKDKEYIVMSNYAPDNGNHDKPELVIMRTEYSKNGEQLFYSIKDGTELETAFTFFMRRFYDSQAPDVRVRSGVGT